MTGQDLIDLIEYHDAYEWKMRVEINSNDKGVVYSLEPCTSNAVYKDITLQGIIISS